MDENTGEIHVSDLQPIENDAAIRGLELARYDLLLNAPELDDSHQALQTVPDVSNSVRTASEIVVDNKNLHQHYTIKISRKMCWIFSVGLCIVTIAVAIGVGLGVVRRSGDAGYLSSPMTITTSMLNRNHSISPTEATKLEHGLVDNSTFSIVTLPNGDKHLFFQENGGNIRQAVYQAADQSWATSSSFILASNAKYNTPISANYYIGPSPSDNLQIVRILGSTVTK